jgi:hypothetical protein
LSTIVTTQDNNRSHPGLGWLLPRAVIKNYVGMPRSYGRVIPATAALPPMFSRLSYRISRT